MPLISTRPFFKIPLLLELQKLIASDTESGDLFGTSVSISPDGSVALVGAMSEDGAGSNRGAAYIFTNQGSPQWTHQQKLTPSDTQDDDFFGRSVSLSSDGSIALIGANEKNEGGTDRGAAYIFTESDGIWTQQQKLTPSDVQDFDVFGSSVSLSSDGSVALIGAYGKNSNTGAVYVFTSQGSPQWTQQQKLTAGDAESSDDFGFSVSLSLDGSTALIGAYGEDEAGSSSGAAYIFTESGGTWTEQQKLTASDAGDGDQFGISVSISSDGSTALIGANAENGTGSLRGAAYVFTSQGGSPQWTQQQKLTASDTEDGDQFGYSVSLSPNGSVALIGAYREDGDSFDKGAAYHFTETGGTWTERQKITASDAAGGDRFGYSVSISSNGSVALVGNSNEASYIFEE